MITLTFIRQGTIDVSSIPAEWRENITQQRVMHNLYLINISVDVEDSSYRYRSLMQRPQLVLKFNLPYFVEFPIGTYCTFQQQRFTLNDPENIKKQGSKKVEYTITLGTKEDNLALYKLRNSVDGRLKWSMCAKPHEFIEEIIKTLNSRDGEGVWYCNREHIIEATEKTIEFNHVYCDAALSSVAETFETEYEVIDHNNGHLEIALHKVEYFKDIPLPLSYGRGNGFVPGVGRTTQSDGKPIKRLYAQGGERNIDRSKYGELFGYTNKPGELRLPKSQTLEYEDCEYSTDANGYYIERSDKTINATKEDSLDCSEIYPSFIGEVTTVEATKPEKNYYDVIDNTIPQSLNFNNYIIAGENMTIIFQSGMLAGKEFEVRYKHDERRWEIVPQEIDGVTMPNETYKPAANNKYAIFGIMLPESYICDNENQSGAAWDMFRECARYLHDHEEQQFTFSGELQSMYAKRNWLQIGAYMKVGAYIHFTDNQFAVDGMDIRVIGVKDYVNSPYSPTLEISNSIQSPTTASSQLSQIDNTEVLVEETEKKLIQFTKRRFRDAKETIEALEDAQLQNFTGAVSPVAVQTMAMLVGDESLQFRFVGKTSDGEYFERKDLISFNNDDKVLICNMQSAGMQIYLQHLTIGQNAITTKERRDDANYLTWQMQSYTSPVIAEADKKYYLYAKVSATNTSEIGTFVLTETSISMEQVTGYYHLLVGILNSEFDGTRSFATLYGFTEILPGRITTDIIVSNDGKTYMNLATGEICGNIKFLSENDEYITLIEGGKIKTELLDVSQIIARSVIVGEPNKQRVEITPNYEGNGSVKIFDEEDNEVTVFEGQSYDSINDLYDSGTGGDCSILSRTSQKYGYCSGVTLGRGNANYSVPANVITSDENPVNETIAISQAWHTSAPTEVTIKSGHLHAYAYATAVHYQSSGNSNNNGLYPGIITTPQTPVQLSSATAQIIVRVETFSDEAMQNRISSVNIAYATASAACGTSSSEIYYEDYNNTTTRTYPAKSQDSGIVNIANKKVKVPAGWHRLALWVYCTGQVYGSNAQVDWGFTSGSRNDITAAFKNDSYVSRFFANGFCLGTRSDNYIMAMRTADGMRFIMENNELGFDFSKAGIRTRAKGKNWMPLPLLIYKASYYYLSSNDTYPLNNLQGYKTFNGNTLPATRTGKGLVTLTFPDSWKTDLGSIGVENLLVHVNAHHQVIDARIQSITTSSIKVAMSDDASLNDGDFGIVIYYLPS